jgi:MoxR-like ATPase
MKKADDVSTLEELKNARERVTSELRKIIVGQQRVLDELLVAFFAGGHAVLIGVPGLAKTLMISTLAGALDLSFRRIQFTPDLMPSDITGTEVLQEDRTSGERTFRFIEGPVFTNVVLADEVNRTPPKTQAALLQAMQEREVTTGGQTRPLPQPFFVLATQNPIELEGTYPLPEAQLDRFMFSIVVDYPEEDEEKQIVASTTGSPLPEPTPVLDAYDVLRFMALVRRVPVAEHVVDYAVRLVRASRPAFGEDWVADWVTWGAGPRASQYLVLGAKVRAALDGRPAPSIQDVQSVAGPVLRHRIVTSFTAEAEGVKADDVVGRLLKLVVK